MSRTRPRHRSPQQLFLVASVHILRATSIALTVGFLLCTVILDQPQLLIGAGISLALLLISAGIHLAEAAKTRCPVCTTTLFGRTGCSKHRTAHRLFGSYRLHTASEILTRAVFHCHHCGEGVLCRERPEAKAGRPSELTR